MTFGTSDWSTAQTVTVTAGQDLDAAADAVTLTHAVTGAAECAAIEAADVPQVAVTVDGDEIAAVVVSELALTVAEGGSGSYTVVLDAEPTGDVTVELSPGTGVTLRDGNDMDVEELLFTTNNWSLPQTVTVAAVDDDADEDNFSVTISHAIKAGSASEYTDPAVTIDDVGVTVADDDIAGVEIDPPTLTFVEGGSGEYTAVLTSKPTEDVMVAVAVTGDTDVSVSGGVQGTLTFTADNWDTAQTVTVSAGEDTDTAADTASVVHKVTSDDTFYEGLTVASVSVSVSDNDTEGGQALPVVASEGSIDGVG